MDKETYAIYLYPQAESRIEEFDQARARLTARLKEAGFTDFTVSIGGRIPDNLWAIPVEFPGTRSEVLPRLPDDLVNPPAIVNRPRGGK